MSTPTIAPPIVHPKRHQNCPVDEQAGYPYDCGAASKYPDDRVFICRTHYCWWHIDPATGQERQPDRN